MLYWAPLPMEFIIRGRPLLPLEGTLQGFGRVTLEG